MLEYRALGGLSVVDGADELNVGGPRQRRLVAMLLVNRNCVVSVDRLGEAVFAGEPTPAASTTLRSYIARLRRVVDRPGSESRVVTQPPGYKLEVGEGAFDVARFEDSVATGRSYLARGEAAGASRVLCDGLGLWRGGAYAEFSDEDWARPEAQRLGELRLVAYELLAEAELACGRAAEVVSDLEGLAAEHPLRESIQGNLMLALYRSGRQVEALRAYQEHREVLATELGLDPSPELADLERRILAHDDTLRESEPAGLPLRGYRLGERLGTGRDGTVYAGRLPGVDRDLAIRVVPEAVANDSGFVRSFDADARRVASLRHEAVVPIYDWWREPGAAYIVMRRMRGGTLRDRIERGPVPVGEVAALVARVGSALVAAAESGAGHGRVTADSVLFDESGTAYLDDFALGSRSARELGDDVRELAGLVAEAVTGRRPSGAAVEGVPAVVAEVLDDTRSGVERPEPPPMDSFVPAVVAALVGEPAEPAHARPNPYKGLQAFDEPDADDFFGRDGLVDEILSRFDGGGPRGRLVLVVGGSGSGKSSVVRAGLLPRVRRGGVAGSERWFVAAMVPGASPFKELAETLRRVAVVEAGDGLAEELAASEMGIDRVLRRLLPEDGEVLLVVDQLEELFTLADEGEQRAFLDGLTDALSVEDCRLRVVATLRADFYDRPLRFERFGAAVGDATVPIAAMSAAELEAAVVGPAERVGGSVEPALVAELVGAVLHEPAALPSLQFTLYELAARSPDGNLSLTGYRELGGVDAAIAARAEDLYRSLGDRAREGVRRLFERLVVVGAEGGPTRRRVLRSELADVLGRHPDDEPIDVIEVWAQARLLTLDRHPESREPTVEVAHEALLREWPRLRGWLEEDREEIVALGHLRDAAASWTELDRDSGALYRGARLDTALDVTDARAGALPPPQRDFLEASRAERDRERQRETEHLQRTAKANRRLRAQLVALAVALVVALVVGSVAVNQRGRAQSEGRVATARELAAASVANLDVDPERSVLLALAAVDRTGSANGSVLPEAVEALHRAVTASRVVLRVPGVGGALDWSPDGSIFVTEGPEDSGLVDIRDARTGESVRSFESHDIDINEVAFNHDGTMLATVGDYAARIWDPTTGDEVHAVEVPGDEVWGPSFSPDGSLFAAVWPGVVRVLDLASGRIVREIRSVTGAFRTSFDPSGSRIVVSSREQPRAVVLDVESGDEVLSLEGHLYGLLDVAWSPDGTSIATSSFDGSARIFDARTGRQRFALLGHLGSVSSVAWSPDSTRLVTASHDGTAKAWLVTERGGPRELVTLSAQDTRNGVQGVAFSPDGRQVMTGDVDIAATRIWDVTITGDAELANLPAVALSLSAATYTPDGRHLVATGPAGSVNVWDARTFRRDQTLGPPAGPTPSPPWPGAGWLATGTGVEATQIEVSPDGGLVAVVSFSGRLQVWDATTGEEVMATDAASSELVAWSPGGDYLAVADNSGDRGLVTIRDRAGREIAVVREEPGASVASVAFSPDGGRLVTVGGPMGRDEPDGREVVIWDWRVGEVERTIDAGAYLAVLSPTGELIATVPPGTSSPQVEVWDWTTGQRVAAFARNTGAVADVAFSADGSRLATASGDGTVRVWDPRSGEQLLLLRGHKGVVSSVAFSPDGSRLASAGADGIVRMWALDLDDLVEIAEDGLTRTLTDEECRQYLHSPRCP